MNYETLQIQIEAIAQNAVSSNKMNRQTRVKNKQESRIFYRVQWEKSQNIVVTHPSTPLFFVAIPYQAFTLYFGCAIIVTSHISMRFYF